MLAAKKKIGYYSALILLLATIAFALCFIGIYMLNPVFEWSSLSDYVDYTQNYNQTLKYIAQFSMIVLSISLVVAIAFVDDFTSEDKKVFSKLSLLFAGISSTLISLGYFIQITSVRWNFEKNTLDGLEQFIQFYPDSAILALIMLGYTLFMGLSSLALLPVLRGKHKWLYRGFLINGIACILGFIGFIFQIIPLILLATNLGNGIGLLVIGPALMKYFKTA